MLEPGTGAGWRILAAALVLAVGATAVAGPKAEVVGPALVDFGRYPAPEAKAATFRIANAGDAALTLTNVRHTCGGCAEVTWDRTELQPGAETSIKVTILGDSIAGKYRKFVFAETSDPERHVLRFEVTGEAVPLVEVSPRRNLHAGRLRLGSEWRQVFELACSDTGARLGAPTVGSNYPVQAQLLPPAGTEGVPAEGGNRAMAGTARLLLRLTPDAARGDLACTVSVPVLRQGNRIGQARVVVTAQVGDSLVPTPGAIALPASGEVTVEHQVELRLVGDDAAALRAQDVSWDAPDGVTVNIAPAPGRPGVLQATLRFSPAALARLAASGPVAVRFRSPTAAPVEVTCQARQ